MAESIYYYTCMYTTQQNYHSCEIAFWDANHIIYNKKHAYQTC